MKLQEKNQNKFKTIGRKLKEEDRNKLKTI